MGGHLEVLKWARANGCEWDEWICYAAARGGHLEVLKWAKANGCPYDAAACKQAANHGLQGFMEFPGEAAPHPIPKISEAAHKAITEWITANPVPLIAN